MRQEVFRMERVTREVKGEVLLDNLHMHILAGEIMGFIAAEAKGKQEFIALLENNLPILYGRISLNGEMINSYAGSQERHHKIYMIKQNSQLVSDLTVADNIFVLRRGFRKYILNKKMLGAQVERELKLFGLVISPDKTINQLTVLERCIVELLRAKLMGCRLIVLCDLHSFLNYQELEQFHQILKRFCEVGVAFLYIGNHHEDIFKVSDRTILFTDGRIKKIFDADEMDNQHIAPYIVSFGAASQVNKSMGTEKILELIDVKAKTMNQFGLSVRKGECVAILDTDNSVLDDLLQIMIGGQICWCGTVRLKQAVYSKKRASQFGRYKVAMIQENPTHTMIFPDLTYLENLTFLLDQKLHKTVVKKRYLQSVKCEYEKKVGVNIELANLSDVEPIILYELIYYRIHLFHPDLVFCRNPFAFGDMKCRSKVLDLIQELKNKGITVILLSVNISDSLQVADRLLIAADGMIKKEYLKSEFDLVKR